MNTDHKWPLASQAPCPTCQAQPGHPCRRLHDSDTHPDRMAGTVMPGSHIRRVARARSTQPNPR